MPYAFKRHAAFTPETQALLIRLQTELHQALVATNHAYFQPGKAASLSLLAQSGVSLQEVSRRAGQLTDAYGDIFVVEVGATCVNILIRSLDKATGVRWLADETGIPRSTWPVWEMPGVTYRFCAYSVGPEPRQTRMQWSSRLCTIHHRMQTNRA